jgi:hypothetical protein
MKKINFSASCDRSSLREEEGDLRERRKEMKLLRNALISFSV